MVLDQLCFFSSKCSSDARTTLESDAVGIILEFGQRRSIRQCAQCGCRMSGRLKDICSLDLSIARISLTVFHHPVWIPSSPTHHRKHRIFICGYNAFPLISNVARKSFFCLYITSGYNSQKFRSSCMHIDLVEQFSIPFGCPFRGVCLRWGGRKEGWTFRRRVVLHLYGPLSLRDARLVCVPFVALDFNKRF